MTLRVYIFILAITTITSCDFKSAEDYLKQGNDKILTGNFKAAIQVFDKAIQKNPKLKEAYIQRGFCYENILQDSLAINDYKKLLSFDPKNTAAFYYMGICRYRQNKFEEAIECYNNALITKGISILADTSSPRIVIELNRNEIPDDKVYLDVAPYEIYYERGLVYYSTQQIRKAFYDFENCITQKFHLGDSYYMVGLCWLTANKKYKACEAFRDGSFYGDSLSRIQLRELCQ